MRAILLKVLFVVTLSLLAYPINGRTAEVTKASDAALNISNRTSKLSTAFTCPSTSSSPLSVSKCLYYLINNDIYQLCFPKRTKKLIYSIPNEQEPERQDQTLFKASSGHVLWGARQKLSFWNGAKACSIRLDQNPIWIRNIFGNFDLELTSFLISPNGQCIVWCVNGVTGYPDDDAGRLGAAEYKAEIVYASKIGPLDQKEVFRQSYRIDLDHSDHREKKKLLTWSRVNPATLYMTTYFEEQLYKGYRGIKAINFISGKEENIGDDVEEFLAISPDEKKVAYTPNDETCCAGTNYTNNAVIIKDIASNKNITIYDEWKEFGNEGKEQDYFPFRAAFSPDGTKIAISITGGKQLSTIRTIDGTGKQININDRFVIGWLNQNSLILGKMDGDYEKNRIKDAYIFDIKSGKEESLSLIGVTYLDFE